MVQISNLYCKRVSAKYICFYYFSKAIYLFGSDLTGFAVQDEDEEENDDKKDDEGDKTLSSNTRNNTNILPSSPRNNVLVTPSPNIHTPPRIGSINDLSKLIADVARSQSQQKIVIGTYYLLINE